MRPERWRIVEELYQRASDLRSDDWPTFLKQTCGTDEELLREVESLLRHGAKSQSVLDMHAITVLARDIVAQGYPTPLAEGQILSHYRILKAIGQGGMGVVYAAEDTKLRRRVALKLLPMFMAGSPQALRRFESEAQAASALNHPNICTVYEIDQAEGLHFIAIELLEGETLKERIARAAVEPPETLAVADDICSALDAAHSAGIVHRDIKPSNIFITRDRTVKLLDFGVAKRVSSDLASHVEESPALSPDPRDLRLTSAGGAVGTVAYMSPEQAQAKDVDRRSDLFSLGAVMYEMTTGRPPYPGKDVVAVLHAIQEGPPVPIEKLNAKAPAELVKIVNKAMHRDRTQRYQQACDMQADVRLLQGRLQESATRRPWRAVALITLFFALTALVFVKVWRSRGVAAENSAVVQRGIKSLAVLPLRNLTGDSSQEYFADGVTDALINNLSKISSLRVISRDSTMQYKGTSKAVPQIASQLNVNAVVEGSVVRNGDQVHIHAQLLDGSNGQSLWESSFEEGGGRIPQLEDELAQAIMREVTGRLSPQEQQRLLSARFVPPEAYEAYLKGRFFASRMNGDDLNRSVDYFREAIQKDPNYAAAYAGLAETYQLMGVGNGGNSVDPAHDAFAAAKKAVELDDSSAEAHTALGTVLHRFFQDWDGAEREFQKALELNPNFNLAHVRYSTYLATIGREADSCKQARIAHVLDPLNPRGKSGIAGCLYEEGHFDEAVKLLQDAIEMDPRNVELRFALGDLYEQKNMSPEAVQEYESCLKITGRSWMTLAYLSSAYAGWGKTKEAEQILKEMAERFGDDTWLDASTHARMGRHEQAIRELVGDGHCEGPGKDDPGMSWLRINWRFDPLRSDPRFKALEQCYHYPAPEPSH
ncbi:MAG TPA: protein kinase [Terriglobales bacterium]|nr:protein kinase [Terriglobales bacterium]